MRTPVIIVNAAVLLDILAAPLFAATDVLADAVLAIALDADPVAASALVELVVVVLEVARLEEGGKTEASDMG